MNTEPHDMAGKPCYCLRVNRRYERIVSCRRFNWQYKGEEGKAADFGLQALGREWGVESEKLRGMDY